MRFLLSLVLLLGFLTGCSDPGTRTQTLSGDTSMRSIDSSAIINNRSRLPQDSTSINVAH